MPRAATTCGALVRPPSKIGFTFSVPIRTSLISTLVETASSTPPMIVGALWM